MGRDRPHSFSLLLLRIGAGGAFAVAELLAILLAIKRQGITAMANSHTIYLLPFLLCFPWIIGMRGCALAEKAGGTVVPEQTERLRFEELFLSSIIVAYAGAIFSMAPLIDLLIALR
jgi:hypothetical protein